MSGGSDVITIRSPSGGLNGQVEQTGSGGLRGGDQRLIQADSGRLEPKCCSGVVPSLMREAFSSSSLKVGSGGGD